LRLNTAEKGEMENSLAKSGQQNFGPGTVKPITVEPSKAEPGKVVLRESKLGYARDAEDTIGVGSSGSCGYDLAGWQWGSLEETCH